MATTTPKKQLRELTHKQRKFVKAKAAGKTGTAAAMEAYGLSYGPASSMASENMKKPSIKQAIEAEFEKQGITLARIIAPINDALDADKVSIVGNGDQAMAEVTPDHGMRLKASNMAAQFLGLTKQPSDGTTNYNFINLSQGDKGGYTL